MATRHLSVSHDLIRRRVRVHGKIFFHRQCKICRRDFVMPPYTGEWRATHVGLLGFDFLDDETNQHWVSDPCPGQQLPDEINDGRLRRSVVAAARS